MSKNKEPVDMLAYEKKWCDRGYTLVAGIDEAGRGPLAGPVVAACALMPLDDVIEGVNDSKQLSEKKREALFPIIKQKALAYAVVAVDEKEIDRINILNATKQAMLGCLERLTVVPDVVLLDAVKLGSGFVEEPIIHGDALSYNIACASILAKVTRDHTMLQYADLYPQYGFEKHKGYGTAAHIAALKTYGPCPIHRRTFIGHFVSIDE